MWRFAISNYPPKKQTEAYMSLKYEWSELPQCYPDGYGNLYLPAHAQIGDGRQDLPLICMLSHNDGTSSPFSPAQKQPSHIF